MRSIQGKQIKHTYLVLGSSVFGHVIKATKKDDKECYAIKIIPKNKVKNSNRFIQDVNVLRSINHPNVVKIIDTYEDLRNVYVVMEICEGQTLIERLLEKAHTTEEDCRKLFKQIILAVNFCHQNGVCHRDLKPETFIFYSKADSVTIKAVDFGLSMIYVDDMIKKQNSVVIQTTRPGRPIYVAPEVQTGRYGPFCDVWAAGVILYILLTGVAPFSGTDTEIFAAISNFDISYDTPEFQKVTKEAKDLLRKMLTTENKRYSAADVLRHTWINQEQSDQSFLSINYPSLSSILQKNQIKQVVLTYIATQMQQQEIIDLQSIFEQVDLDQDGFISIEEMRSAIVNMPSSSWSQNLEQILKNIETKEIKTINYLEFMASTMNRSLYLREEKFYQIFKILDHDRTGKISECDLISVVQEHELFRATTKDQINYWKDIIHSAADKNVDGQIDYMEFIQTVLDDRKY